jgi:hypothetical protein
MKRAVLALAFSLFCASAGAQYPIYPAMPQPMVWPAYGAYQPGAYSRYSYSPYGYGPYGFGGAYGGLNWLPPTLPSPYFVVPSGRQYLEQVRQREQTTYSQLKVLNSMQK